ncbi:succinyl-CoA synthetase subunit beta [Marinobacter sediminum]|uniref:succinyl-CoA synthetase subunit beta n=1 Tax=Marinobacter sediminum TaxID=256323 RepID=UPI002030D81A|nr:succinyl-CoA synthetase subunit beta [Marinobacter sediminum]MCM0612845.1 succinyl-CoA synthetase subunit beta [Marinobacter sediminum]
MSSGAIQERALGGWQLRVLAVVGVLFIAPLLFIGGPEWTASPLYKSAWNLGHIGLFAIFTFALQPWRRLRGWSMWLAMTTVVLLAGILIEVLQSGLNRQADWHDVLRNLIGTWLVLAWQPYLSRQPREYSQSRTLAALSALLLVVELGSTGLVAIRQFQVSHQLPMLYDFQQEDPAPFWSGRLTPSISHARNHSQSLRINLGTETYSGVSLNNLPADWRGYKKLVITLYNPGPEALKLTLRVNDVEHDLGENAYNDRYNTRLILEPQFSTFTLDLGDIKSAPAHRSMDMDNVRRLGLFATRLSEPETVYLLELRLE